MKYLLLTLSLFLYIGVLAQEEEEEYFEESIIQSSEFKNLSKAKYNILNVRTLDLNKNQADNFLKDPINFPYLENLVISFSKIREIQNLKNKKLTSIRIMYSWNLETLSNDFNQYEELKNLEIYNCSLTELPNSIFNNKSISSICLCNNKITDFPEISENNNINELYLDLNKLKKLPNDFLNLKELEILTLKHCEIDEFPKVILNLKKIRILDLGLNSIEKLPSKLGKMTQLEKLYIPKTNIRKLPSSFKNSSLKYLMIDGEKLSNKEKEKLKLSLPKNCKIEWTDSLDYQVNLGCGCLVKNARF